MSTEVLALPLLRFPLPPSDPLQVLCGELENNLSRARSLPWMVLGATHRERLAVVRTDLSPGACARVERGLAQESSVVWTALCGDAWLPQGGGTLRYAFARIQGQDGGWRAALRPFLPVFGELVWLEDWNTVEGVTAPGPQLRALFPEPEPGAVRFVAGGGTRPVPTDVQPIPEGASEVDITRVAGLWLESFFFARGFVPPSAVAVTATAMEIHLLPRSAAAQAAPDLAVRLAQEPEVRAVGVFSRDRDARVQPPAEQIRLWMEWREGPGLLWRRRFRVVAPNTARWLDPHGELIERSTRRLWFSGP